MMVADTDTLIDYLAGENPVSGRIALELEHGLHTTSVTRAELLRGATSLRQRNAVATLLDALDTLPLDAAAADRAGAIARDLDAAGQSIAMADALIAGIVIANGGVLLTRNQRHFTRIAGLRVSPMVGAGDQSR
jgi:predicted nucleic acid-binding protein